MRNILTAGYDAIGRIRAAFRPRFSNLPITASILILTSCASDVVEVTTDSCATLALESYSGVALALPTGTATFVTEGSHCPYVTTSDDVVSDQIFEAWAQSPYEGYLRPIYISVDGNVISNKRAESVPWFDVETMHEVSVNFTVKKAREAFKRRLEIDLPPSGRKPSATDPQKRVRRTD